MKIVTFNLSCDWYGECDGINGFIHRAIMIYEKIKAEKPDVIAFQEVVPKSLEFLRMALCEYDFYGQLRDENYDGEGLYTAVRKDKYAVVSFESFWLSPTPKIPGSRFPQQSLCPRICVVTDIRDKATGKLFRMFNVHLDHISDNARVLGIECVLGRMAKLNENDPMSVVLLGDFNSLPDSPVISTCESFKPIHLVELTGDVDFSYHAFGTLKQKLDYIFTDEEFSRQFSTASIWSDCRNGVYLSDHYPVELI